MSAHYCANCATVVDEGRRLCAACVDVERKRKPLIRQLQIAIGLMLVSLVVAFAGTVIPLDWLTLTGFAASFLSGVWILIAAYRAVRPIDGR